jgi:hypothetical protein
MTATFLPRRAKPHAMLALVVVLPTPPLPDVTTMISDNLVLLVVMVGEQGVGNGEWEVFVRHPGGFQQPNGWSSRDDEQKPNGFYSLLPISHSHFHSCNAIFN